MSKRTSYPEADYAQLRQRLLAFVCNPDYQPKKASRLLREANVPEDLRWLGRDVIEDLVREGVLVQLKHKGLTRAEAVDLLLGIITFTRSGSAFVNTLDGKISVFIPNGETGTAMPGDRVLVRINRKRKVEEGATSEGTVVRVEERACRHVVGTLGVTGRVFHVTPMQSTMVRDIVVPDAGGAEPGDRVLVRLEDWVDAGVPPSGEVTEVLGDADNPQLDTLAVVKAYALRDEFPADVLSEAEQADFSEKDYEGRNDLRDVFTFTIDPKSARDYDDAISLVKIDRNRWELGVHVADVEHFVKPGSALDREAAMRSTSVYFPDKVLPMLPVQLSNGMCSLNPHKDRLAFSVLMTITNAGVVEAARFCSSVIHSNLRTSYHQALSAINSGNGADFPEWNMSATDVKLIKTANKLANKVRQRRFRNGALHINLPQTEIHTGKDGRISKITPVIQDPAHQLIEEFMILANEAVSREFAENHLPQIYRIHEEPDPEKIADLEVMFLEAGIRSGDLTNQRRLSKLLLEIDDQPQSHVWYMRVLRSLKRAAYSTEGIGHYGLAKQFYCHFTSPIRRYPDIIMHRMIKAHLQNAKPMYSKRELAQITYQSTQMETNALEAEREVLEQKKIRYFAEQLESGNPKEFDAIVTEVRNFGLNIELPQAQTYGMIHVSHMTADFFDYIPARQEFRGRRTKVVYQVGSRLKVVIVRVDARKRFLDFAPAGMVVGSDAGKPSKIKGGRVTASGQKPGARRGPRGGKSTKGGRRGRRRK